MDIEEAAGRARTFLAGSYDQSTQVAIDPARVLERAWCHVFFWNSAEYLRTGDSMDALWGNAPIVVPKDGSAAFTLGTHRPVDVLLDEHERRHDLARGGQLVHRLENPSRTSPSRLSRRDVADRGGGRRQEPRRTR